MPVTTKLPIVASIEASENKIKIQWDNSLINVEIDNPDRYSGRSADFAAFLLLPIAMRLGRDLHISGTGDAITARNAEKLSNIWESWCPDYKAIRVSFDHYAVTQNGVGELLLYSGGLDSTYNLLKKIDRGHPPTVLTIQGGDYLYHDQEKFHGLIDKSRAFLEKRHIHRIIVRTDSKAVYRDHGVPIDTGHGFALISCLFIFNDIFKQPVMTAGFTKAQDFQAFPWGTNHVTNPLFATSNFALRTECDDVTRAERVAAVYEDHEALNAISFCKDYEVRPHNCGVCSKCVRTKAMFIASVGKEPHIFLNQGLRPKDVKRWNFKKRTERVFFHDLYKTAERNGHIHLLPGLEEAVEEFILEK